MPFRLLPLALALLILSLAACTGSPAESGEVQRSSLDTTLAHASYRHAEALLAQAQYDSAFVHFEKAAAAYEAAGAWERHLRSRNKAGECAWRKGSDRQAKEILERALAEGRQRWGEQHREVAHSYYHLGILAYLRSDYDESLELSHRALEIRLALFGEQHPEVADSYTRIGLAHGYKAEHDQSLSWHEKALAVRRATLGEKHSDTGWSLHNVANCYAARGEFERALKVSQVALEILESALGRTHASVSFMMKGISRWYLEMGDIERAKAMLISANRLEVSNMHPSRAELLANLGYVYMVREDWGLAIEYYRQARDILEFNYGGRHVSLSKVLLALSMIHRRSGNYEKASETLSKSVMALKGLQQEGGDLSISIIENRGLLLADQGHFEEAYMVFNEAAQKLLGNRFEEEIPAYLHNLLGRAELGKGRVQESIRHFRSSYRLGSEKHLDESRRVYRDANALAPVSNLAEAFFRLGRMDSALSYVDQSIQLNGLAHLKGAEAAAYNNVAFAQKLLTSLELKAKILAARSALPGNGQDLELAVQTYQEAARLIGRVRGGPISRSHKLRLVERSATIHDQAIQAALQLYRRTGLDDHLELAFWFSEKSKAGILLESLQEADARQFAGIPDSLLEHERSLRERISSYEGLLANEDGRIASSDTLRYLRWQDALLELRRGHETLIERFERDYPDYHSLKYQTKTASVAEIRKAVGPRTALVSYFTGTDSIYIFTVTRNRYDVAVVPRDSLLEQQVEGLRSGIVERQYGRFTRNAHDLYQRLVAPVRDRLTGMEHLLVIPDGMLSYVPFETLLTRDPSTVQSRDYRDLPYLIEEFSISYAYSATLLQEMRRREAEPAARDYLAFAPVFSGGISSGTRAADFVRANRGDDTLRAGGHLPFSEEEVTRIRQLFTRRYGFWERLFGDRAEAFLKEDASERNLKARDLSSYRYLHFATHGFVNETAPELSGIVLAQDADSTEDDILHLGEVYNLKLSADLVVLSACETGLGRIARGEGIIGLARGFLYAGARNMLVSLWKADDAASCLLMVDFYERLLRQDEKAAALRQAKRAMIRRDPIAAQPCYWAPFILVGQ